MPLFTTPQAGNVRTAVYPGDKYTLFDGTESPSAGLKSVAFNRAPGNGQSNGMVFAINFASAPTATVQIQASNDDTDANYITISTVTFPLTPAVNGSWFADYSEFKFYRAVLSAYSAGGMPVVTVQRQ